MEENLKRLYEFGPFRLDAEERLLLRDGEFVPLTPKAFNLLLTLLEQPGHLIEKEALMQAVWPDSFVEENNLADNISRLRKALGEGENGQKFIETVPKRGYRFSAEVRCLNGESASPSTPALPQPTIAPWRLQQRPEVIWIAIASIVLLLTGVGLYLRSARRSVAVEQIEFKGNFYLNRWDEADIRRGIENYQRAIALAPNSASAYEGLATGWMFLADLHAPPREVAPKAKAAIADALQHDEASAQAHLTLGMLKLQYDWDWTGTEQEFQRAFKLDPENYNAHRLYGWYLIAVGRLAEAQTEMQRALGADPQNWSGLWGLGDAFYFARQYEQAVEQYRRAIGVEPQSHWPHLMLGWAYEQQGKFSEAIAELNQARRPFDNPQIAAALGHAYAASGQRAAAQKVLAELQEIAQRRYVSPYDVATIYAGLGEQEQALNWLEKAYADRCGWLALWLKVDPKFDGLRADERFRDLLRRVGHTS